MFFYSPNYLVFFILMLIPFFIFKRNRMLIIAVANVIFYSAAQVEGANGLAWLLLFMFMCLITFISVHMMRKPGWSWIFWVGIGLNVFNLVFYKYTFFALSTIESLAGIQIGFTQSAETLSKILPLGISFYTFEFISYLIDVRRGRSMPTKSFLSFWVFVSTFPHLIAGPIMRGDELLPQIQDLRNKRIPWSEIKYGLYLILIGLIKKVVIADNISPLANAIFDKGTTMTGTESWIGSYAFTFQIYYDFSAYTDLAIGCGIIMGLRFADNFRTPYLSKSPQEFWNRWHITLSRWIRDYIYIGLGGNRKGAVRTYINLFAAMVISGLWHGANWTFILWGALWGALLVVHRLSLLLNRWTLVKKVRESLVYRILAIAVFFHVIVWTWVFFRAKDVSQAITMTWKMIHALPSNILHAPEFGWIALLFLMHIVEYLLRTYENSISRVWHVIPFPIRSICYLGIVFLLIYFLKGEKYDFIYFQF
ncbi:MBOAT family protein [Paenibacillus albiflavus]|uniref:MBOAT family protein n=1 Tax=Paenibacillus albiflavus TaxID=2545760 RepID=A0A4V2WNU5_9BACL|nr:MBOAT family O-acyltransferase [Paenibacillus albiflavus]TCZ76832.1 MBOAT family protein [Paenibacillus albiflavus]